MEGRRLPFLGPQQSGIIATASTARSCAVRTAAQCDDEYMYRLSWPSVIAAAQEVVDRFDSPVTLRQLYYVLASEGVIPLTAPTYRRLSSQLASARRRGEFPVDALIDLARDVYVTPSYSSPGELLEQVPAAFRAHRDEGQQYAVFVVVEKDTLRVQMTRWLDRYGVPVLVVRGYTSQTYANRVAARVISDTRPAVLFYVGDLDASGEDIERDWIARTRCWSKVRRLAVTTEQAADLPPATGKAGDPRWPAFAERHQLDPAEPVQYEVEAIAPGTLRTLVLDAVDQVTDLDQLARVLAQEATERQRLQRFLARWPDADSL